MRIGLVPVGKRVDEALVSFLAAELGRSFGLAVEVVAPLPTPRYAYDQRRRQYLSSSILIRLRRLRDGVFSRILGIAEVDLFVPSLNFVFGEADMVHGVALISLFRLRPENYGRPPEPLLLRERALKEAVHELGHTFGLMHCPNFRCVMYFSNQLADTDRKRASFCRNCQALLSGDLKEATRGRGR